MLPIKERFSKALLGYRFMLWPVVLSYALTLSSTGLNQWLHIPFFLIPWLSLLIWLPFVVVWIIRQWKESAREREELQARFDAEDEVLFGENRNPN